LGKRGHLFAIRRIGKIAFELGSAGQHSGVPAQAGQGGNCDQFALLNHRAVRKLDAVLLRQRKCIGRAAGEREPGIPEQGDLGAARDHSLPEAFGVRTVGC